MRSAPLLGLDRGRRQGPDFPDAGWKARPETSGPALRNDHAPLDVGDRAGAGIGRKRVEEYAAVPHAGDAVVEQDEDAAAAPRAPCRETLAPTHEDENCVEIRPCAPGGAAPFASRHTLSGNPL